MKERPKRIQRKRAKGWRTPPNTVYVGRPTKWGNPVNWKETGRQEAVWWYKRMIYEGYLNIVPLAKIELRGKNLSCFCPLDEPCHADILLEIANK